MDVYGKGLEDKLIDTKMPLKRFHSHGRPSWVLFVQRSGVNYSAMKDGASCLLEVKMRMNEERVAPPVDRADGLTPQDA